MAIIKRSKNTILGLNLTLQQLANDISSESQARAAADGDLSELLTEEKATLVGAINEVLGSAQSGSEAALQISQNLADLDNVEQARTNIDVYSTEEVDQAILDAGLALGTNYNVADITERDALENLDPADRIFVADDGDGKWAMYKPYAIEDGVVTDWIKLSDQDALEHSISALSIKEAYESNENTNAFTDAHKAKVDFITVTQGIDLDDAVLKAGLEQDLEASAPTDNAPSAAAVKAYADEAARNGGAVPLLETLTVSGSTITLTHPPKGGIGGIMNHATVRYFFTDTDGTVAYDATLAATVNDNEFTVETDEVDEWDGFQVQVQYLYTPAAA
jgi:hypothetical protein